MSEASPEPSAIGQLTGHVIGGRYRLGDQLGQGGMGVVYAAMQESLARPVALKVLQPMLAQNGESILRFKAEAERAGRLAHPHIVQILDFGHEPGASAWIAMELLRGESLGARIERGPLSEAEVVRIAKETLSALEAAHGAHLVHRDLKPDNIFLSDVPGIGSSVKVLDFGIAKLLDGEAAGKLTATGMLIGTPLYMAPEQARGDDVDQRADLYALGAVLYEALTGRPPFTGKNYNALLFAVLSEAPTPLMSLRADISPVLANVISRAMAKLPEERFQSAREMGEALRGFQPSEYVPVMHAANGAAIGSAPTMATPVPNPSASTPVMGGASAGVSPSPASSGQATPSTNITPAPLSPAGQTQPSSTPVVAARARPTDAATQQGFRWWPVALAGGALAMATLAFVGVNVMSGAESHTVAFAPSAEIAPAATGVGPMAAPQLEAAQPATLTPIVPTQLPMDPSTVAPPTSSGGRGNASAPSAQPVTVPEPTTARPTDTTVVAAPDDEPVRRRSGGSAARRTYPRPSVRPSGGSFGGLASNTLSATMNAEGGWADCWPRTVPAPEINQGRDFLVNVAGDGHVVSATPAPRNEDPVEFSSCVVNKLERLDFGPTATGEPAQIRVGLHVEIR